MSTDTDKFAVELPDGSTLSKNDTIEHADLGPITVTRVTVGPHHKTIHFVAEVSDGPGRGALELTGQEVRDLWGETIHDDPMEILAPRIEFQGVGLPDRESPSVDLMVSGEDMKAVELVAIHARAEAVRAMEAIAEGEHPDDVAGHPTQIDWERVLAEDEEESP